MVFSPDAHMKCRVLDGQLFEYDAGAFSCDRESDALVFSRSAS